MTDRLPVQMHAADPVALAHAPIDHDQVSRRMDDALRPDLASGVGGGAPLPGGVRGDMEHAFGTDLGSVRVHESAEPAAAGAVALARGEDIHFRPGGFDPDSASGRQVLGHELTHVVQQRNGRATGAQFLGAGGDGALEAEADVLGARAAAGQRVEVRGVGGGTQYLKDGDKEAARKQLEPEIGKAGLLQANSARLLAGLDALLDDAASLTAARDALERAIFDAITDEEASGLTEDDKQPLRSYAQDLSRSTLRTWSMCRSALRGEAQRLRGKHIKTLGRDAFLERLDGEDKVEARGRYSGSPLVDDTMEVTILVHKSNQFGHTYIVFEWFDPHTPEDALPQRERRRHEVYHLEPTGEWQPLQREQPPIRVVHLPGERGGRFPQKKMIRIENEGDREVAIETNRRSWRVPYAQGNLARQRAQDKCGEHECEQYSLFGRGGESCQSWATHIAEAGGISARSWLGSIVEIPVHENAGGEAVDTEDKMWEPRDKWRALVPRLEQLCARDKTLTGWKDWLTRQFNDGRKIDPLVEEVRACEAILDLQDEAVGAKCEVVQRRCKSTREGLMASEDGLTSSQALKQVEQLRALLEQWRDLDARLGRLVVQGGDSERYAESARSRFVHEPDRIMEVMAVVEQLYLLRAQAASNDEVQRECDRTVSSLFGFYITADDGREALERLRKKLGTA